MKYATNRYDARVLNQARLQLALIHQQSGEIAESQVLLNRIGIEAPPEIYAHAKILQAQMHRDKNEWQPAVKLWEEVRWLRGAKQEHQQAALQGLSEGYAKLNRPDDAKKVLQQVQALMPIPGEVPNRLPDISGAVPQEVVAAYTQKLHDLDSIENYLPKEFGSLEETRTKLMSAYYAAIDGGDFDTAFKAAQLMSKVYDDGRGEELQAIIFDNQSYIKKNVESSDFFNKAASLWSTAGFRGKSDGIKTVRWMRAAETYLQAENKELARTSLDQISQLNQPFPVNAVEGWLHVAELYLQSGSRIQAKSALQTAAQITSPSQYRAQVQLARYFLREEPAAQQAGMLLQTVLARPDIDVNDPKVHEEASFLLGESYFQQEKWLDARQQLQKSLENYPQGEYLPRGKMLLAQTSWALAGLQARKIENYRKEIAELANKRLSLRDSSYKVQEQIQLEKLRDTAWASYQNYLNEAGELLLAADELYQQNRSHELDAIRTVKFLLADCYFFTGEYEKCLRQCESIVLFYPNKVESLEGWRNYVRCCEEAAKHRFEAKDAEGTKLWKNRQLLAIEKVKQALETIPTEEWDQSLPVRTRSHWQTWYQEQVSMPKVP
ncbi:MAG: tetratricopeptide repeat protein [Zavarzinella sp.]